jgi:hypothetical protein
MLNIYQKQGYQYNSILYSVKKDGITVRLKINIVTKVFMFN